MNNTQLFHLHSTMFIFIFNASFGIPLEKCPFTFHYVYIYIGAVGVQLGKLQDLHSTMFIFISR